MRTVTDSNGPRPVPFTKLASPMPTCRPRARASACRAGNPAQPASESAYSMQER
jgi:hypothetical protein